MRSEPSKCLPEWPSSKRICQPLELCFSLPFLLLASRLKILLELSLQTFGTLIFSHMCPLLLNLPFDASSRPVVIFQQADNQNTLYYSAFLIPHLYLQAYLLAALGKEPDVFSQLSRPTVEAVFQGVTVHAAAWTSRDVHGCHVVRESPGLELKLNSNISSSSHTLWSPSQVPQHVCDPVSSLAKKDE